MFISLIYNNKKNNITYLTKPFKQKLTKRFTGNKRTVDIVGSTLFGNCRLGAGCVLQNQRSNLYKTPTGIAPCIKSDTTIQTFKSTVKNSSLIPYTSSNHYRFLSNITQNSKVLALQIDSKELQPQYHSEIPQVFQSIQEREIKNKQITERIKKAVIEDVTENQKNIELLQKIILARSKIIVLINAQGKYYETIITQETKSENFTEKQTITELAKRGLIIIEDVCKNDGQFKVVPIKLKNGEEFQLNKTKYNVKLTPMGQAYAENLKKQTTNFEIDKKFVSDIKNIKILIIVPPKATEDCLVEIGNQKHLLVVLDNLTGDYYCIGYLTSKKTGNTFSICQYKNFEQIQEQDKLQTENEPQKLQNFKRFTKATKIDAVHIKSVKYSDEYIANLSLKDIEMLQNTIQMQKTEGFAISFDSQGLTKEDCFNMCHQFDLIAKEKTKEKEQEKDPNNFLKTKSKIQHPLTKEQKNKNKINKDKMVQKNDKSMENAEDEKVI